MIKKSSNRLLTLFARAYFLQYWLKLKYCSILVIIVGNYGQRWRSFMVRCGFGCDIGRRTTVVFLHVSTIIAHRVVMNDDSISARWYYYCTWNNIRSQ